MPTLDYCTGFNHQTGTFPAAESGIGFVTNATTSIDTSTVRRTGGASLKCVAAATAPRWTKQLNGGSAVAFVSAVCYLNFSVIPTNASVVHDPIFWIDSPGAPDGIAASRNTGTLVALVKGIQTGSGVSVSVDTWYRLEFGIDVSATTYTLNCQIATADGTATLLTQQTSTSRTANPTALTINAGLRTAMTTGTFFMTDLAVSVQSADYPIGPTAVYGYSPDAVGTHNLDAATSTFFFKDTSAPPGGTTTALTTSETTSYQSIDEIPIDGDTDAVKVTKALGSPDTPTFRAAGTWSFSANNVASPFTCTPGAPAGKAVGDLLLLVCECRSITATVGTPAGWNVVSGNPFRSGTASGGTFYLFTRIADGTASDTPSPIWTGQTTGTSGDACGAGILAYTNLTETVDATAAIQDLSAQGASSTITGLTTATDNSVVINAVMKLNESSAQTSTVTTYTEAADNSTTSGTGHIVTVDHKVVTSHGASGSGTVTWSATTSARALIVSIALKATVPLTEPTNTWYAEYDFGLAGTQAPTPVLAPYAVTAICDQRLDTAVSSTWAAKLFDQTEGTNTEDISNGSISATAATFVGKTFAQRPNTGGAWTLASLNAVRLRFGYTASAAGHPRLESAMLEAAFLSPQTSGTTYTKAGYAVESA